MSVVRCEEGVSTKERIAVTGDVLNITGRLKEIDESYFVMLNKKTQRFEVHVRGQAQTLGCELPFEALDARTIEYVRQHHASRIKAILAEMEAQEAAMEQEKTKRLMELHERAADGMAYVKDKRTTDEFPDEALEVLNYDAESDVRNSRCVHRSGRRLCNHHGRGRKTGV